MKPSTSASIAMTSSSFVEPELTSKQRVAGQLLVLGGFFAGMFLLSVVITLGRIAG